MNAGRLSSLAELHRRYLVEETAAALRHDLRNKFASIANARFYLRKRIEKDASTLWSEDPRMPKFFDLISSELVAAEETLTTKLPPLSTEPVEGVTCDVMAVLQKRIAETRWPEGVKVIRPASSEPLVVTVETLELELALSCLIENSIDAGGRTISLRCPVNEDGRVAIEIVDDGGGLTGESSQRALESFFTTKPGRLGVGLNIVKRVVARAKGELQLGARPDGERGVRAAMLVRRQEP